MAAICLNLDVLRQIHIWYITKNIVYISQSRTVKQRAYCLPFLCEIKKIVMGRPQYANLLKQETEALYEPL